jgi:hypothetical protein
MEINEAEEKGKVKTVFSLFSVSQKQGYLRINLTVRGRFLHFIIQYG